jgi:hypothetical protein
LYVRPSKEFELGTAEAEHAKKQDNTGLMEGKGQKIDV